MENPSMTDDKKCTAFYRSLEASAYVHFLCLEHNIYDISPTLNDGERSVLYITPPNEAHE